MQLTVHNQSGEQQRQLLADTLRPSMQANGGKRQPAPVRGLSSMSQCGERSRRGHSRRQRRLSDTSTAACTI